MYKGVGGTVEAFYFAVGDDNLYMIVDMPIHVDATALYLMVNASGSIKAKDSLLITPEEVDQAIKKTVNYRPPEQ
jgi:uncharacterized protein with GYD domain